MMEIKGICGATLTEDYRGCLTCKTSMQRVIGTGTETNISLIKHLCEGCPMAKLTVKCGHINKPKVETGTVDLQKRVKKLEETLTEAQKDIAAMLFLSGECQYCKHCVSESVYDATKYSCKLGNGVDCRPEWRGAKHE